MKKIFLLSTLLSSVLFFAQQEVAPLQNVVKVEAFIDKIGVGYELPISNKVLLDFGAGIGGANVIAPGEIAYRLGKHNGLTYNGVFLKGQLRYYISRENRANKNRSLESNAGSFIGIQSKYNFNGNKMYIGKTLLTDAHFGQQLPLGKSFIFRYHIGLGYGKNFDEKYGSLYPATNIAFAYLFKL